MSVKNFWNGDHVRALVLPGDKAAKYVPEEVEISEGDLCDVDSLERFSGSA